MFVLLVDVNNATGDGAGVCSGLGLTASNWTCDDVRDTATKCDLLCIVDHHCLLTKGIHDVGKDMC